MNQEESISSFERAVEDNSVYALKLRTRFGNESYYRLLKELILHLFKKENIAPFGDSNVVLYLVFSSKIYSGLKRGLNALETYVDEGDKKYLSTQLDDFNKVLESIYAKALELDIPPLVIEIGLRKWIRNQITPERFDSLYKKFVFMMQFVGKKRVREHSVNAKIIDYLKGAKPLPSSLQKVTLEQIAKFIEPSELFYEILKELSARFINKPTLPRIRDDSKEIKEKVLDTQKLIKEKVRGEMATVLKSIDKFNIGRLREAISEMEKSIVGGEAKLRGLELEISTKELVQKEGQVEIPEILQFFDPNLSEKIDEHLDEVINLMENRLQSVPDIFIERHFLGRRVDYTGIIEWFVENYKEIFIPTVVELILEEMVKVWPQVEVRQESVEEARWIGILARNLDPQSVFFIPKVEKVLSYPEEIISEFRETVSVMVYDIRGSSIMGEKLQDARKEDGIRNEFQKQLSDAVRNTNGFLLKDTGDGGIVFFSANSGEVYADYKAFLNGSKEEFPNEELVLVPSHDASLRAVQCAKEMIKGSERFVRKNLKRYKDWFKVFEEEGVGFGGITYEKLPPEYKRIFQIGIGIASGKPDKDIFLGPNVIGNPDLTGRLVREANTCSKARHPDRSVILIDTPTMCSFLIALEKFESSKETREIESHSYISMASDLRREIIQWMKGLGGDYKISDYKVSLKRIDSLLGTGEFPGEVAVSSESVRVKRSDKFYDAKSGIERVIYEVIPEERW